MKIVECAKTATNSKNKSQSWPTWDLLQLMQETYANFVKQIQVIYKECAILAIINIVRCAKKWNHLEIFGMDCAFNAEEEGAIMEGGESIDS